jgi:uncharacterized membrane protein YjfL (UPF0719 family)
VVGLTEADGSDDGDESLGLFVIAAAVEGGLVNAAGVGWALGA